MSPETGIASVAESAPITDLATRCYLGIRDGILRRRYLPGERLLPDELAREFGVSRTPVHDALKRLALEGLVEIHPRRGTVVTRVTARELEEIADLRTMIELHAAAAAVARATPADVAVLRALVAKLDAIIGREDEAISHEAWYQVNARFHRLLIQLTGNEQLLKLYDGLNLDGRILRVITGWGLSPLPEALRESQRHHREMLEAVEARDVAALQDVLRIHIQHGIQRALSTLRMMGGVL